MQGGGSGTVVVLVSARDAGIPLPNAVGSTDDGTIAFGDDAGRVVLRGLKPGAVVVRVRRIGFSPDSARASVTAGTTDTVRVALPRLALQLLKVRISDNACRAAGYTNSDTSVARILEQVRTNAEHAESFAIAFPHQMQLERVVMDVRARYRGASRTAPARGDTVRVDTLMVSGEFGSTYRVGGLIRPVDNVGRDGARERMVVPRLTDFASPEFIESHCFRFVGVRRPPDDSAMLQIDFRPARSVREPDVSGTIWLDTATFQIRHTTLTMDRPSPDFARQDRWHTQVDSWFHTRPEGAIVVERIEAMTTVETTARNVTTRPSLEIQRLLEFHYLGASPPE
jgi:hypothetical protein